MSAGWESCSNNGSLSRIKERCVLLNKGNVCLCSLCVLPPLHATQLSITIFSFLYQVVFELYQLQDYISGLLWKLWCCQILEFCHHMCMVPYFLEHLYLNLSGNHMSISNSFKLFFSHVVSKMWYIIFFPKGAREKVRSPKTLEVLLWGPWLSMGNVRDILVLL